MIKKCYILIFLHKLFIGSLSNGKASFNYKLKFESDFPVQNDNLLIMKKRIKTMTLTSEHLLT